MKINHLNDENFSMEIASGNVLVHFFAAWCSPCNRQSAIFEELTADDLPTGGRICKVNIDDAPGIAAKFKVDAVPTLIYFADGREIRRTCGTCSVIKLQNLMK